MRRRVNLEMTWRAFEHNEGGALHMMGLKRPNMEIQTTGISWTRSRLEAVAT